MKLLNAVVRLPAVKRLPAVLALLALPFVAACDENNAVSVRLRLQDDLSGSILASALAVPTAPGAVETAAVGATFERQVELRGAKGRFTALDGLAVADVKFSGGGSDGGLRWVRVEIPTGPAAQWPDVFVPLEEAERRSAAEAFEASSSGRDVGRTFKVEIELPGPVISNGASGKLRGTKNTSDGRVAMLVIPIDAARAGRETLVWQLTW